MNTVQAEVLDAITRALVAELRAERIILFGSRARGDAGADSDVDLLVVADHPPSRAETWALARRIAPELPVQLVVMTPREWEETRDVIGGMAYPAHREGQVLYAA